MEIQVLVPLILIEVSIATLTGQIWRENSEMPDYDTQSEIIKAREQETVFSEKNH